MFNKKTGCRSANSDDIMLIQREQVCRRYTNPHLTHTKINLELFAFYHHDRSSLLSISSY